MSTPTPIRSDVVPAADLSREMLDYCAIRLAKHRKEFGDDPDRIAFVTMSKKGKMVHSFSMQPDAEQDCLATCASAAALLLSRALK